MVGPVRRWDKVCVTLTAGSEAHPLGIEGSDVRDALPFTDGAGVVASLSL